MIDTRIMRKFNIPVVGTGVRRPVIRHGVKFDRMTWRNQRARLRSKLGHDLAARIPRNRLILLNAEEHFPHLSESGEV